MYGKTIIVVTKNVNIRKNLNLVNFVFNKFIINPKYIKKDENAPKIKKRILMCTTPNKVKVYGVWYKD